MSSFSERLSAAKEAERPTREVMVCLDTAISEKRAVLQAELEAARNPVDARLSMAPDEEVIQSKLDELNELTGDALVTLRFTRLSGAEWSEIAARCPVRLDVPIDRQYGYNIHAACRVAAPLSGVVVDGESVEKISDEEWSDLFSTISGHEFGLIVDAIYALNEWEPASHVAQLKKELATRPV